MRQVQIDIECQGKSLFLVSRRADGQPDAIPCNQRGLVEPVAAGESPVAAARRALDRLGVRHNNRYLPQVGRGRLLFRPYLPATVPLSLRQGSEILYFEWRDTV